MERIIYILLTLCPFIVFGQGTRFVGTNGAFIVDDSKVTFTNSTTAEQVLFRDTIPAGKLTVNREYVFTAKLYITVPALSIPSVTFRVTIAGQVLTFVSSAGMITGATGAPITITGYIVKTTAGTTYLEFSLNQPGSAVLSFTSSAVNESADLTIDNSVDVPLTVGFAFSGFTTGTTQLVKKRLKRSDF